MLATKLSSKLSQRPFSAGPLNARPRRQARGEVAASAGAEGASGACASGGRWGWGQIQPGSAWPTVGVASPLPRPMALARTPAGDFPAEWMVLLKQKIESVRRAELFLEMGYSPAQLDVSARLGGPLLPGWGLALIWRVPRCRMMR
jgi:hypothetical protein